MGFWRGFKTYANGVAAETRASVGLGVYDRLDVEALASYLGIPLTPLSGMVEEAPHVAHLLDVEPEVFSAVTVFAGNRRMIVHNDGHAIVRQRSNVAHELSHGLLQHPPTPALDDSGCRNWNQDIEDEASHLAGCLLMPEPAVLAVARGRWTQRDAAGHFEISTQMVRYRLNVTGAHRRVARAAR